MGEKLRKSFSNKTVSISVLILVIFGSLMIASAEMGNGAGDSAYLSKMILRQLKYAGIALVVFYLSMQVKVSNIGILFYQLFYVAIFIMLVACRFFAPTNGAYAWIKISSSTSIQPSEFAKVFMITFAGRLFAKDYEDITKRFFSYIICAIIYLFVIVVVQHDLGSGVVLLVLCYTSLMIPPYDKLLKYQRVMRRLFYAGMAIIILVMSPFVTELLKNFSDDYRVARFLAAADPFLYRYDNGYHIIMSLVSLANGNIFGLGYGNSIHKYMNFPNPSNDFILPVIVEELGVIGFIILVGLYITMLYPIVKGSIDTTFVSGKIILLGTFLYFTVHFILNVGGVSGLIPLTGVPLLIMSSGGSSLVASMMSLGFAQAELKKIKKDN